MNSNLLNLIYTNDELVRSDLKIDIKENVQQQKIWLNKYKEVKFDDYQSKELQILTEAYTKYIEKENILLEKLEEEEIQYLLKFLKKLIIIK
jgi:hypothetical protein